MKKLIQNLIARRVFWFFVGVLLIPVFLLIKARVYPTPKEAMGLVGYYEENRSQYTFIGDHTYSLKFPGDRDKFIKFVEAVGLDQYKISEDAYLDEEEGRDWSRGVKYDENSKLKTIHYYSSSH